MRNFFRNIPWKQILSFALVAVIGIGAIVGISSAVTNKTKTISSLAFARGAIDENGQYVESEKSIYTEDLIECQGLRVEPDFEATGTYQVFYYNSDKTFLGATEVFDAATDGEYNKGDSFAFAKYCRVMITPDAPKDDDGFVEEDFKIRFYNVTKYANQYTITTRKNQSMNFEGLENYASKFSVVENSIYVKNSEGSVEQKSAPGKSTTTIVASTVGSDTIGFVFDEVPTDCTYIVCSSSNKFISTGKLDISGHVSVFTMPTNGAIVILNFDNGCAPAIYNAQN